MLYSTCALRCAFFFFFVLFSFSFFLFCPSLLQHPGMENLPNMAAFRWRVCRTLRNERSAPVQNAHTSFVLKLNKKPFSNFLLSNFVFLYFFATLEAFALTASRSLRASRAGQSARAVRDFIIPKSLFTYSSMYVPLK